MPTPPALAAVPSPAEVAASARRLRQDLARRIVGMDEVVDLVLLCVVSGSHGLLVGVPGLAKTLLVSSMAELLELSFKRIQFTPDLMPSDIVGTEILVPGDGGGRAFRFQAGPVFTNLLLADEINRTPPKTQAALLQAMQERTVTIDGIDHKLSERFMVVATQNPIESQGVYPLPEAQLDRFLFKFEIGYPSLEQERQIVAKQGSRFGMPKPEQWGVAQVADHAAISAAADAVAANRLAEEVVDYVVRLVRATRATGDLQIGASPRAAATLAAAARAHAALDGRDFVLPDDVKKLAPAALRHRVILSPAAEIDGRTADAVIAGLIEQVEAPR